MLSERGLDGVAGALAALIGGPALIFDARGELLARRGGAPLPRRRSTRSPPSCASAPRAGGRRGYVPGGELAGRALALPVARRRRAPPRRAATARRRRRGWSPPRTPGR